MRRRYGARIDTLFPVWGLLPHDTQVGLERVYGFEPHAGTRSSIAMTLTIGLVAIIAATYHLARAEPVPLDAVVLAVGAALLLDAGRRHRSLRAGRVVGSPLGLVLRPFAARMLR